MTRVLFIADKFADEFRSDEERYPGGAELTDAAAIAASPFDVVTATFADLPIRKLDHFDIHIVGNSGSATEAQIDAIAALGRHVLFEHDLRICEVRGNFDISESRVHNRLRRCTCRHLGHKRLYRTALGVVYLTQVHRDAFHSNPFFRAPRREAVLGCSLFSTEFFERVEAADREASRTDETLVLQSPHRMKGTEEAKRWCRANGFEPTPLQNLTPGEVLERFSRARRFVFLPRGTEAAGRMPVEARLLGCEVVCNHFVGVARESWWAGSDEVALAVLRDGPARFWRHVVAFASGAQGPIARWPLASPSGGAGSA